MIAPDPALAGPRPSAPPREAARAAEPERPSGGDFDSVLKEPAAEKGADQGAGKAEAAPGPDAAPPAPEGTMALAVMVPAAALPLGDAPPAVEAGVPEPAVALPLPAAPALATATGAPAPEAAAPPPPERIEAAEVPKADAKVTAAPARGNVVRPAAAAVSAVALERPREIGAERQAAAVAEAPPREARAAETAVREVSAGPAAPAAAPAGGDGVQGWTVRDAAPPAWHLAADAGQGPARPEAAAQVQVQVQAQVVQPQAVAGQVAVAIGRASDDRVEIRLDPPELGRVQIHLTRHDGGIQAVVIADRPETQDLLRRHAEVLVRELGQAGYDSVSLDFAGGEARAGRDDGRSLDWAQAAPAPPVAAEAAAPAAAPSAAPSAAGGRSAAGGLDVRL